MSSIVGHVLRVGSCVACRTEFSALGVPSCPAARSATCRGRCVLVLRATRRTCGAADQRSPSPAAGTLARAPRRAGRSPHQSVHERRHPRVASRCVRRSLNRWSRGCARTGSVDAVVGGRALPSTARGYALSRPGRCARTGDISTSLEARANHVAVAARSRRLSLFGGVTSTTRVANTSARRSRRSAREPVQSAASAPAARTRTASSPRGPELEPPVWHRVRRLGRHPRVPLA